MSVNDPGVIAESPSIVITPPPASAPTAKPDATVTAKPDASTDPEGKPPWLDDRLARAREAAKKEAWKELGFESPEDAKKAAEDAKAAREAKKTEAQKRAEAETALAAEKARVAEMTAALGAQAEAEMQKLTDSQRDAVKKVAGDDPAAQLKSIVALRPTWGEPAAPAAIPAVQDTAPGRTAPSGKDEISPPDPKAVWASLKESNPILAARYALSNGLFDNK